MSTSTGGSEAHVSLSLLKIILARLDLVNGNTHFKTKEIESTLSFEAAYGVKKPTVFQVAHCITVCGMHSYNHLSMLSLIRKLTLGTSELLRRVYRDTEEFSRSNPLQAWAAIPNEQLLVVVRVLEKERKALQGIFDAYADRFGSPSSSSFTPPKHTHLYNVLGSSSSSNSNSNSNSSGGVDSSSSRRGAGPYTPEVQEREMSILSLLQFARDFHLCPDLISKAQVLEVFGCITSKQRTAMIDGDGASDMNGTCPSYYSHRQYMKLLLCSTLP